MGGAGWFRILVRAVGVAGLLGLLVVALLGPSAPFEPGVPAPPVENARRLDGKLATLKLAQGRPLVINIWATWCTPCLHELPALARSARKYGQRVGFVALATESPREDVLRMAKQLDLPFDVAEINDATARAWRATALPSTYIVDPSGRIAWSIHGMINEDLLEQQLAPLLQ